MKNQDQQKNGKITHQNHLKMVFFGTSDFAIPTLSTLIENSTESPVVITQPDKPTGRKGIMSPSPVKTYALKNKLKVLQPETLKNEEFFEIFKDLKPDICILVSYGKIIPEKYLSIPKYGFINVHPSLLPKYRGPSPIQTAILNGDEESGVTIMLMDKEVDHGPILSTSNYRLSITKNFKEAESELAELGAELLNKILPEYISGKLKPREQDHSKATFSKILTREDGKINWNLAAKEITNQIRALNPEPGTWTKWDNKILNIISADSSDLEVSSSSTKIGDVIKIDGQIGITTGKYILIIKEVQLAGSKKMNVKDFINGHRDFIGVKLE